MDLDSMSGLLKIIRKYKYFLLGISETLAVVAAYFMSLIIIKLWIATYTTVNIYYLIFGIFILISSFILSKITTRAILPRTQRFRTLFFRYGQSSFIEFIIATIIWALFPKGAIPFIFIPVYCLLSFTLTFLVRIVSYSIFKVFRKMGYNTRYVLLVADSFSDSVIEDLLHFKEWGFRINYIISNSKLIRAKYGDQIKIYRENIDISQLLDCHVIDEVIYCKCKVNNKQIKQLIRACDEIGVIFRLQSSLSPLEPLDLEFKTVIEAPYLKLVDTPANHYAGIMKSISDVYFSILALTLLLPFFLLIALIIKIDSRGPIFFIQERIGLRGRKFRLYKFRTMVSDAEELLHKLQDYNEVDGPVFKIKKDPRVTRVGRILRKTGLDEVPQLINVIKGEMSLIGPRPPVASEVVKYERWQLRRLSVKPGITCTWQATPNRHNINFERWMRMDLKYIDNWSYFEDIKLFFRTFLAFFLATGH
jgi:exopolysaccharide biosynthesis polyprenyl glycosylphosphotransferase